LISNNDAWSRCFQITLLLGSRITFTDRCQITFLLFFFVRFPQHLRYLQDDARSRWNDQRDNSFGSCWLNSNERSARNEAESRTDRTRSPSVRWRTEHSLRIFEIRRSGRFVRLGQIQVRTRDPTGSILAGDTCACRACVRVLLASSLLKMHSPGINGERARARER